MTKPFVRALIAAMQNDDPTSSIAYAIMTQRAKFAALAKTHGKDEPATAIARVIVQHLTLCGYGIVRGKAPAEAPTTHPRSRGGPST